MKTKSSATSFFSGVIVLTIANLITKIIGLIFKIPLTNMLGDQGMGYFNTAYQIYTWLYMISTAGLPVALSMMISECDAKGKKRETAKIFQLTLLIFGAVGILGTAGMLLLNRQLAAFISADLSYACILAIAPAFFFVCISSTIRGFFQGHRNMIPTALSEIIEAICKMSLGIFLGGYALKKGLPLNEVAAYSIIGVTVGVAAGALFLLIAKFFSRINQNEGVRHVPETSVRSSKELMLTFLKIAIPVMLSSSLLSMSSMLDTMIVIRRLRDTGLAEGAAITLYGNYTAYCVTLFNLPPVLIYPIVNTLIPSVSAARAKGDTEKIKKILHKSLKLAAVIALPCAFGLATMSEPILKLIFSSKESAELAAPLLSTLAPSVFLIGIMAVTNGILQACRLQKLSLLSMLFGAVVKGVGAYLLVGMPLGNSYLHMYGAPISTFLFYLTITIMNIYFIVKYANIKIGVAGLFLRPFFASVLCALSAMAVFVSAGNVIPSQKILTLLSIAVGGVVYAITLLLLGGITKEDFTLIPKGEKLYNFARKLKLIK